MATIAQEVHTIHVNQTQIIIPDLAELMIGMTAIEELLSTIASQVAAIKADVSPPEAGNFNPPSHLVKTAKVEVEMSVIQLEVGQTAVGKLTFSEPPPFPSDGTVASSDTAVATISLGPDLQTWTLVGMSVGTATASYTGTSEPPDVGPVQVAPMMVTVVAVPAAETGDFDPSGATITGP